MDEGKVDRYLNDMKDLIDSESATMKVVKSVLGQILYLVPLIPKAELHVAELHHLNSFSEVLTDVVDIPVDIKECLEWLLAMMRLCKEGLPVAIANTLRASLQAIDLAFAFKACLPDGRYRWPHSIHYPLGPSKEKRS